MQPRTKSQIRARDGHRCVVCGGSDQLSIHHIRPKAIGGVGRPANCVTLCRTCHDQVEHPIRDLFTWLASLTIWLVYSPILTFARIAAPLRWRVASLKPSTFERMEIHQ
jgi:HNH endonuclease